MTVVTATSRAGDNRRLVIASAALVVVATLGFAFRVSAGMPDFEVYLRAAERALAGEPLYRAEDGHWLFKYLPIFAVVIAPIAVLPLQVAKAIWFTATVAALAMLLRMTVSLLPRLEKPGWWLVAATVLVMGKFYAHELTLGQSNLLLAATVAGALLALKRRREALAGALVVVAIVLKPYAVILLPWLLARRRRTSFMVAALGTVLALVAPIARYGIGPTIQLHLDWWQTVVTSVEPNLLNADNVSWVAMYSRWFGAGPFARWLALATTLAAFGLVIDVFRRRQTLPFPELLEAGLLLTMIPFLSPQGWDYTLVVATPAVMCLINYERGLPPALRAAAIVAMAIVGLTIYDVMGRAMYSAFMARSGITIAFLIIITAVTALRRRRIA